jgi:hypothetical protein
MTIKNQTHAANRTDDLRPLDDGALDRVAGGARAPVSTQEAAAEAVLAAAAYLLHGIF